MKTVDELLAKIEMLVEPYDEIDLYRAERGQWVAQTINMSTAGRIGESCGKYRGTGADPLIALASLITAIRLDLPYV